MEVQSFSNKSDSSEPMLPKDDKYDNNDETIDATQKRLNKEIEGNFLLQNLEELSFSHLLGIKSKKVKKRK